VQLLAFRVNNVIIIKNMNGSAGFEICRVHLCCGGKGMVAAGVSAFVLHGGNVFYTVSGKK